MKLLREYIQLMCEAPFYNEQEGPEWANWFHLSRNDLGNEFTFTPKEVGTPYQDRYGDPIEDFYTKRTSWAPSVHQAAEALEWSMSGRGTMYIYAVDDLPGEVDLKDEFSDCHNDLSTPDNEYGEDFEFYQYKNYLEKFLVKNDKDYDLKKLAQQDLYKCVPDAPETGEHWATKPVTAKKVGKLQSGNITWF